MSMKAGRVGVNPSQVNPVDGSIISSATSGYTKQEADAKFLTQTEAVSTYESKSAASAAHNALQPKTLAVPIEMLDGSKLTVESALQGLNTEKFTYADNGILGAKNLLKYPYTNISESRVGVDRTVNPDGTVLLDGTATEGTSFSFIERAALKKYKLAKGKYIISCQLVSGTVANDITHTFRITKDNAGVILADVAIGTEALVDLDADYYFGYQVSIPNSATLANAVIAPMIRLVTDPDNIYQPYAMTNRELTEYKIKLDVNLLQASSFADFQSRMSN